MCKEFKTNMVIKSCFRCEDNHSKQKFYYPKNCGCKCHFYPFMITRRFNQMELSDFG